MRNNNKRAVVASAEVVAAEETEGIIPKNLSKRDEAFAYMLAKEMVVTRLIQKQMQQMQEMREQDSELIKMNKKLNKKVVIDPRYVKTKDAASYLDVDPSFLTKAQNEVFEEGIHYFRPEGSSILRWDLAMLEKWLRTAKDKEDHDAILDQMFA